LDKYLKWSDCLILVYSIVDNDSFLTIGQYLESICDIIKKQNEEQLQTNSTKKFSKVVLLGNKIDMERYRLV
jgi:hypothetical protein